MPGNQLRLDNITIIYYYCFFLFNFFFCHFSGSRHYLHTINLLGPLLVVFGGCQGSTPMSDCYTNELTVYNTLCDTWKVVEYPGLPINSSRYSHSTILHQNNNSLLVFGGFLGSLHHDMLQLHLANCSIHQAKNECLHQSAFCAWSTGQQERCVSVVEADNFEIPGYSCAIGMFNVESVFYASRLTYTLICSYIKYMYVRDSFK